MRLATRADEKIRMAGRAAQLQREIERLRAALLEILTKDPDANPPDWFQEWRRLVFRLKGIARAALEDKP